jgi:endonuclease-3
MERLHALSPRCSVVEAIEMLRARFQVEAPSTDPLELIVWENVGYLVDDQRRAALFEAFEAATGCDPVRIASADHQVLFEIASRGGMRPQTRVERWRSIAQIVLDAGGGDLAGKLRGLPIAQARALLKRFPSIGTPGADKILLFSGLAVQPSLESNGLRALARLGFIEPQRSYDATYKAGVRVLAEEGRLERDWLVDAYLLLPQLGKTVCLRSGPICVACPLDPVCAHAPALGL